MAFVKEISKNGARYFSVVASHRINGKVQQETLLHLGNDEEAHDRLSKSTQFDPEALSKLLASLEAKLIVGNSSDDNYTPKSIIKMVLQVLDEIGLDPVADDRKRLPARHHFTRSDNCLEQNWGGFGAVFMNPPYSDPAPFMRKLVEEWDRGGIPSAIALVKLGVLANKSTARLIRESCSAIAIPVGRIGFIEGATGKVRNKADFDTVFIYWGKRCCKFRNVFGDRCVVY